MSADRKARCLLLVTRTEVSVAGSNKDQPNKATQQGAPQETQEMPSSGNSPERASTRGETDETQRGSQDIERSGNSGAAAQRSADTAVTGDPGRTPGKAEGVENPEEAGNE